MLAQNHFRPVPCPAQFSRAGSCWEIAPAIGGCYYWLYAKQELFDIKIHDFYFHEDCCLDMDIPECISIQRYDSISGEELNPTAACRRGISRPSWAAGSGTGR